MLITILAILCRSFLVPTYGCVALPWLDILQSVKKINKRIYTLNFYIFDFYYSKCQSKVTNPIFSKVWKNSRQHIKVCYGKKLTLGKFIFMTHDFILMCLLLSNVKLIYCLPHLRKIFHENINFSVM